MKRKISCLLFLSTALSLAGCSSPSYNDDPTSDEKIDKNKTQLYVYNFNGGFGSEWLIKAKERYEAIHKEDVYQEGKKGVQIVINAQKTNAQYYSAGNVRDNREEVFFQEYGYYYTLKAQGILGDITEALTTPNPYENGKTLEDKLTPQQKEFYKIDGKYYAIPHYNGFSGITYNIDLFEKESYYFIDKPTGTKLEDYFIQDFATEKDLRSCGPDGVKGTEDDGLPRTYTEFFMLCDYIYTYTGNTPLCWTGTNYKDYITYFMHELVADYEGKDQLILNYDFNGTATDLGSFVNGNFVKDASPTTITSDNGYELTRQAGKYYALEFVKKICETPSYHNDKAFNASFSHLDAQDSFLWAGLDGKTKPIAMLIEGIWWENESASTTKTIATSKGSEYSLLGSKHRYGYLPLPKATQEKYEESVSKGLKNTINDYIYSVAFVKSNIEEWKKPLAIDFIQFCNTDESLVEFTQITNTPKALNYTMTEEQLSKMSTYGRSVMKAKQTSDVVYPISNNDKYRNNQEFFGPLATWKSTLDSGTKTFPANAFYELNTSVEDYFKGMYKYTSESWGNLK